MMWTKAKSVWCVQISFCSWGDRCRCVVCMCVNGVRVSRRSMCCVAWPIYAFLIWYVREIVLWPFYFRSLFYFFFLHLIDAAALHRYYYYTMGCVEWARPMWTGWMCVANATIQHDRIHIRNIDSKHSIRLMHETSFSFLFFSSFRIAVALRSHRIQHTHTHTSFMSAMSVWALARESSDVFAIYCCFTIVKWTRKKYRQIKQAGAEVRKIQYNTSKYFCVVAAAINGAAVAVAAAAAATSIIMLYAPHPCNSHARTHFEWIFLTHQLVCTSAGISMAWTPHKLK